MTTNIAWQDLALDPRVLAKLDELVSIFGVTSESERSGFGALRFIPTGETALFAGPSGTGKTLAAAAIGSRLGRDVIHIDLLAVVSKFIGETEKNLSAAFDQAEQTDAVLFFDEADALFANQTDVTGANDRHANQEASFLLQRIEHFNGLVILATNTVSNLDPVLLRRVHSMISFERRPQSTLEREISVDGAILRGSTWMPPRTPRSLVLMAPGSGPATRDNDDFFPPIRGRLLDAGHAVASFDKRGAGSSTGFHHESTIATQVEDASTCIAALRAAHPGLPLGVFGHSQGGWVTYELAGRHDLAFAISNAGPAVGPAAQEKVRLSHMVEPDQRAGLAIALDHLQRAALNQASLEEVLAVLDKSPDHKELLSGYLAGGPQGWNLERSFMQYEPAHALKHVAVPTLVLLGSNDHEIPVDDSVQVFAQLANPNIEVVVLADANHRMKNGVGAMVAGYFDVLTKFIDRALGA